MSCHLQLWWYLTNNSTVCVDRQDSCERMRALCTLIRI
jgi:hypothetical protein